MFSSWLASVELREPWFLTLALLAPVMYRFAVRLPANLTYSSLVLPNQGPGSIRTRLTPVPAWLLSLSVVCLSIAMSGPRSGDSTSVVKREGIAIMLVVDRSGSMDARDFVEGDYSVSRLDAVKGVLKGFIAGGDSGDGRPNDLLGVVAFGTYADGICPLTLDHGSLMAILDDLSVARSREESQTAVGEGLALAVERLREYPAKSKVVILLTDGVNNAGNISPQQASELARAQGVKVYTVGAGSTGVAPMPVRRESGRVVLRPVAVEIDERSLKSIAERTGARYFNARDARGLAETYRAIDALERSELTEIRYLQYEEHYAQLVFAALALIAAATLVAGTYLRRLP